MRKVICIACVLGLLLLMSACTGKRVYYVGPVVDYYKSTTLEKCIVRERGPHDLMYSQKKCNNCSVGVSAFYKGPDLWRRVSTSIGNVNGSVYHNLDTDMFMCGVEQFIARYPEIDRSTFEKFVPDEPSKVKENSIEYYVSKKDWRK